MANRVDPRYHGAMEPKHRLISALLLAALVAAAFGRADLAANTESSVLWSPAFRYAVLPALAAGWLVAPFFGRDGPAGWAIALASVLAVTLATGAVLGLVAQGVSLLAAIPQQPHALGALGFAAVAVQALALRRQSRK